MQIWEKIRVLRHAKSLTQNYVAFYLDITQPAYHKIESGKTKLTYDRLKKLADLFEVKMSDLIDSN